VAGLGYVFTPDGREETWRRKVLRWLVTALYRQAFRVSERVFFQNDDDIAYFVDAGLLDRRKAVRTNGSGVDLEHLLPAPVFERPLTFLLMARLLREKGIVEFVGAARAVKKLHSDVQFVILGAEDPNPGALSSAEVARWVDEGVVQWHGHVDDVRPWLARSSVYVLPSYREGTPRSTLEAMAMARPVITTDAVGCRETVIDGVNGFLVPVRDSEALAASMLRFIDDRSLLASMGAASRRLAESRFDVTKVNAKILATMGIAPEPLTASASSGLVAPAPSARLELS
jgi:glycosyltransferase involved in cell wall biosynthesis